MARKTYTNALRIVQQGNASRDWNTHILQRMADIDMQRLDWKQALRVYEQICTLMPDDDASRKQLIELNMRMGQDDRAMSELESYITHLESQNKQELAIAFLEDLSRDHEENPCSNAHSQPASPQRANRRSYPHARMQLGEALLEKGDKQGAMEVINQIVLMNPPNVQDYRVLLSQMQKS
ncbi:MAG: hypothetical protein U0X74_16455 [Anaerolineales bacterium]